MQTGMVVAAARTTDAHAELYKLLKAEHLEEALCTAVLLDSKGITLTRDIIYHLLQICTKKKDLSAARQIHTLMHHNQLHHTVCLADYLIRLFSSCGSLPEAADVFEQVKKPTGFTWNAIITAHAKLGDGMHALDLYSRMLQWGQQPDKVTFLSVLRACSNAGALVAGRSIHAQIIVSDTHLDLVLGNTLVDMYAKCGSLEEAQNVFRMVPGRNVVSWDAIIGGYAQQGNGTMALQLFHEMQQEGIQPDRVTFLGVLRACSCLDTMRDGVLIHDQIIRGGLESDVTVASTLVDMYSKCGCLEEARVVFDTMPSPSLVSWGCMISGYAQYGQGLAALQVFEIMEMKGLRSDKYIYSGVLKACGLVQDTLKGRLIHERVVRARLESGEVVGNTLADMYAKCGSLTEAQKVFDNLALRNSAAWGSMITGYAEFGDGFSALKVFAKMQHVGIQPGRITYLCVVKACSSGQDKQAGKLIYHGVYENSFEQDIQIGSALVDMFAKGSEMEEARHVFDRLQERNVVTWGAMLTGYAQQDLFLPTLELYEELQLEEIEPNRVIFFSTLKACCSTGTWGLGGIIHSHILRSNLETDQTLGNALVDMYARCGNLQEARSVFEKLLSRDVVSYSAMITGYAERGDCGMALDCLEGMCKQGLKPDVMIFTTALAACSHAGLVDEAYSLFNRMRVDYGIVPDMGHFTCMIDLLGNGGQLREAEALIDTMHISPDSAIWRSLLTSSRIYKDVELGRKCFDHAIRLDPDDATVYTLMTSIYMDANKWDKVQDIQEKRMRAGAKKKPGKACIDLNNKVYEFVVGEEGPAIDDETPNNKGKHLSRSMRGYGYMPQLELVLDQTWKEESGSASGRNEQVLGQLIESKQFLYNSCHGSSLCKQEGMYSFPRTNTKESCHIAVACV
ncbi:hypothetical protein GOP47_0017039 [Adiantum capillus-veneris]|uniref:Pentatricopeptide repeat-containing protein n=1 Tax=Adiantum capillus-veneris TaxID=13818 RepID=A0A9D4ZB90_ADICA|nr:hypothetical protein GOP47_0017039 [Adiantum capillus-veneris]